MKITTNYSVIVYSPSVMMARGSLVAIVTMVNNIINYSVVVYSPSVMVARGSLVTIVTMVHTYYNDKLQCYCILTISNGGTWIAHCYGDNGTYVL